MGLPEKASQVWVELGLCFGIQRRDVCIVFNLNGLCDQKLEVAVLSNPSRQGWFVPNFGVSINIILYPVIIFEEGNNVKNIKFFSCLSSLALNCVDDFFIFLSPLLSWFFATILKKKKLLFNFLGQNYHYMLHSALHILCRYVCLAALRSNVKPYFKGHLENVIFSSASVKQEGENGLE